MPEGEEQQLQPVARPALTSLGACQDLLDTCLGWRSCQSSWLHCPEKPPPTLEGRALGHPILQRSQLSPYRMVPRNVDFSGTEPMYRMCTLAKRELMLQTCPGENGKSVPSPTCSRPKAATPGRESAGCRQDWKLVSHSPCDQSSGGKMILV